MADTILEARGITHYYEEGRPILTDCDFRLEVGQSVAVQGTSGVGKTTLLEILGTMRKPRSGEVRLMGEDVYKQGPTRRARLRGRYLGFVFQEAYLIPDLSLWENCRLAVALSTRRWSLDRVNQRFESLMKSLDMDPTRRDERPGNLSTGERQRLAVIRSLMIDPRLLIADEPTGNLDPEAGQRLIDLLLPLVEQEDTGILVATHDRTLAQSLAIHYRLESGTLHSGLG